VLVEPSPQPRVATPAAVKEGGEARESNNTDGVVKTTKGTSDSRGGRNPISPDSGLGACTENPAKAESQQTPAPIGSGAGAGSIPFPEVAPYPIGAFRKDDGLPTVISKKAHEQVVVGGVPTSVEKPASTGPFYAPFPKTEFAPVWTGRNGTFTGVGVRMQRYQGDKFAIIPCGKRGAGNCIIEIPTAIIPLIVEWLSKQVTK
jgi:hypothetical protein